MKTEELLRRLAEYGADENELRDRFCGDMELYRLCFDEFMQEPSFARLREAMAGGDCKDAFEAAHALKGLAGNLALKAFYNAISALTEALRAEDSESMEAKYAEMERQYKRLLALAAGEDFR